MGAESCGYARPHTCSLCWLSYRSETTILRLLGYTNEEEQKKYRKLSRIRAS